MRRAENEKECNSNNARYKQYDADNDVASIDSQMNSMDDDDNDRDN